MRLHRISGLVEHLGSEELLAATDAAAPAASSTAPIAPNNGAASSAGVEAVASTVLPSVVSIAFTGQAGSGTGSGVVLSKDGVILTNNHVVAEAADGVDETEALRWLERR